MPISRRHFLRAISATGTLAAFGVRLDQLITSGSTSLAATSTTTTTIAAPTGGHRTLVLVTLYGGNDALNTVAPVADPTYRAARGTLALDPATTHPLADGFALHPSLAGLKQLWDDRRLAVVHGVGFPDLDRSHFHCMDVWQAGNQDDLTTGWLGRWLDAVGTTPLDAMAIGWALPLALRGAKRSAAVVPDGPFTLPGGSDARRLVARLSAPDVGRPPLAALVASSTADLLAVIDEVSPVLAKVPAGREAGRGLAGQLDVVAAAIEADLPTRVYSVSLASFDTHAKQAATHEGLLAELDGALSGFLRRIAGRPVTVAVYSEFGRRVAVNGSAGTDHGTAGTMLVAGAVKPGFHGDPPPLDRLVDGDLVTTVDFRSVFGGLLEGVLGVDAGDVLPGAPPPLAIV